MCTPSAGPVMTDFSIRRILEKVVSVAHLDATPAGHLNLAIVLPPPPNTAPARASGMVTNIDVVLSVPADSSSILPASSSTGTLHHQRRLHAVRALRLPWRRVGSSARVESAYRCARCNPTTP